ncbi:hypothetical protein GGTG_11487 [Gaeumannomyces tritici R3-111a-1]|uniref:Uncharacterized protein n=1 Tax=Gaeumannomyces tritici (strain R3-111a-1) TaxID=644352 RepID=J3PDB9_GAET3|nr:hypothetical protein GGTG_11487 [Gaeumannomyces tritici R3-111a-1]EJT70464.1 hypothetical protein GGTG_11487 [Gaeumannomyces tritici R3-111a-1]
MRDLPAGYVGRLEARKGTPRLDTAGLVNTATYVAHSVGVQRNGRGRNSRHHRQAHCKGDALNQPGIDEVLEEERGRHGTAAARARGRREDGRSQDDSRAAQVRKARLDASVGHSALGGGDGADPAIEGIKEGAREDGGAARGAATLDHAWDQGVTLIRRDGDEVLVGAAEARGLSVLSSLSTS